MASEHLVTLRRKVDAHFDATAERDGDAITCTAGCAQCCHRRFDVFEVEAAPIRAALAALERDQPGVRARVRAQADAPTHSERCPLLVDDRCTIYAQRPLICRSHGLPVAVEDNDALHVSWCTLNYRDGDPPSESIVLLEAINAPLAMLTELEAPDAPRVPLASLARAPAAPNDDLAR